MSLLARMELAGIEVGDRWQDVADHLVQRTSDQVLPFLDLHYVLGLARAGRPEADTLLRHIERRAARSGPDEVAWREACVPAAQGLVAWARGDAAAAVDALGRALPRLLAIGGSHAQRDLFAQLHLDAMVRVGHLQGAQDLLQPQLRAQPESKRLRRQATALYESLGLGPVADRFL